MLKGTSYPGMKTFFTSNVSLGRKLMYLRDSANPARKSGEVRKGRSKIRTIKSRSCGSGQENCFARK
jgi:hypothetical protein